MYCQKKPKLIELAAADTVMQNLHTYSALSSSPKNLYPQTAGET